MEKFWKEKAEKATIVSKEVGNIYTGSLYMNLISYLANIDTFNDKRVLMFSYGSGSTSTMFSLKIKKPKKVALDF